MSSPQSPFSRDPSPSLPHHPKCLTTLGLLPPVTAEDVKQAYLAKAKAMHPDRGGDPAQFVDLAVLDLAGGRLTDEGLLQLKGLTNLRSLDLRGTAVGTLAAEVPSWFPHLEFLGLPTGSVGLFSRMSMPRRVKLAIGPAAD